jgi:hypothetical protein
MPLTAFDEEYWPMHFDESLIKQGAGLTLVFISPLDVRIRYVIRVHFSTLK